MPSYEWVFVQMALNPDSDHFFPSPLTLSVQASIILCIDQFLSFDTTGLLHSSWRGHPVHCRVFASTSGLFPLAMPGALSLPHPSPRHNNQMCLQALPNVPGVMGQGVEAKLPLVDDL